MSKQLNLRLGSNCPPHIKARLAELRADCVRRSEEHHRKQRALDNAERYETWQEIQLASLPIKGRR
jgi:hypothetical protein